MTNLVTSDPVTDMIIDCNHIRSIANHTWRCAAPHGHKRDEHFFVLMFLNK